MYKKHDHINFIPVEAANVGVRMVCDNSVSDLCQKNADIIFLKLDPTKCSAEGLGTKVAEIHKSAQFTVHTMYQNGQICGERQVVEAELKSVVNGSITHARVTSNKRGVYEVNYAPEICERHKLIVKVNGAQIADR